MSLDPLAALTRNLSRHQFTQLGAGKLERAAFRLLVHFETQPGLYRLLNSQLTLAGAEPTGPEWIAGLAWAAGKCGHRWRWSQDHMQLEPMRPKPQQQRRRRRRR